MPDSYPGLESFFGIFQQELDVINARRRAVAQGKLAQDRGYAREEVHVAQSARPGIQVGVEERAVDAPAGPTIKPDERGRKVPRPSQGHNLTGLALSGGGIRSASFCLGVLQGLDALKEDKEPQVLDQIDYLSTVSGGGYIGISFVAAALQTQGRFPFASKLDQEETIETQHLRDFSNFLTPNGGIDIIVGFLATFRGFLINAFIFLGIILLLAGGTILFNPTFADLGRPFMMTDEWRGYVFFWTVVTGASFLVLQPLFAIISMRLKALRLTLRHRERAGLVFAGLLLLWGLIAFLEVQVYILQGLFAYAGKQGLSVPVAADASNVVGRVLQGFGTVLPTLWTGLLPAAAALIASAGKLTAVLQSRAGDKSWNGTIKRWASLAALYAIATIVPLMLWSVYILFSFWGICPALPCSTHPQAPDWLNWLAKDIPSEPINFAVLYLLVGVVLGAVSLLVRPNASSLHGYYRDRLSRAFLWDREELSRAAELQDKIPGRLSGIGILTAKRNPVNFKSMRISDDVDEFKFSSLKKRVGLSEWDPDVRFAPYLLVNTAVNLEASRYLNRRGRNADSFIFSPLFMGSEATGYVASAHLEAADPNINLATAMAASGAAASANMGASTVKPLTFSLAALNVRLGYWLPNPRFAPCWTRSVSRLASIGPFYFAMETFGLLNEGTRNVYLTDGGHFDNLGLYELLKRRCRLIIAVDAEADPSMNFNSFVRLQRYARIDLGVRIDLPWSTVRRSSLRGMDGASEGSLDLARSQGPHVAVGRIEYGEHESGVLIYIKSSLSGDESDLVHDYKRRYADFPHETTLDQFFSEEQFEVYRALGFHVTKGFFTGLDTFGMFSPNNYQGWLDDFDEVLTHINIPEQARSSIIERASDAVA